VWHHKSFWNDCKSNIVWQASYHGIILQHFFYTLQNFSERSKSRMRFASYSLATSGIWYYERILMWKVPSRHCTKEELLELHLYMPKLSCAHSHNFHRYPDWLYRLLICFHCDFRVVLSFCQVLKSCCKFDTFKLIGGQICFKYLPFNNKQFQVLNYSSRFIFFWNHITIIFIAASSSLTIYQLCYFNHHFVLYVFGFVMDLW